jgi:hypothetical protein
MHNYRENNAEENSLTKKAVDSQIGMLEIFGVKGVVSALPAVQILSPVWLLNSPRLGLFFFQFMFSNNLHGCLFILMIVSMRL